MRDLDPQLVVRRETEHFQSCFPDVRPFDSPVFPSKFVNTGFLGELEHLKIKTRLINEMFASVMGEYVSFHQ